MKKEKGGKKEKVECKKLHSKKGRRTGQENESSRKTFSLNKPEECNEKNNILATLIHEVTCDTHFLMLTLHF